MFLYSQLIYSNAFMMNCISKDFKEMAFYKYTKKNKNYFLYIRSMKSNWSDFCKENAEEYKVECNFSDFTVKRFSSSKEEEYENKITIILNFDKGELEKILSSTAQEKIPEKKEIYKCRKIKI